MGNKSFSLAVVFLFVCFLCFFVVVVVVFFSKKKKKYWHTENNFLGFYNIHVI